MKNWTAIQLTAVALAAPMLSHAGVMVVVDTFDGSDMFVYDTTANTGGGVSQTSPTTPVNPPANSVAGRTVTHELLAGSNAGPPFDGRQSNVRVAGGFPPGTLAVTNSPGRDSTVSIEWTLPAAFIPDALTMSPVSVVFDLLMSDQDVAADLYFDGVLFGTNLLPAYNGIAAYPVITPISRYFDLTAAQQNTISNSSGQQVLKLVLNGPIGWDLRIDNPRFEVPEPSSLPLTALALAGAAAALRRRKAAPQPG